jgi:cardiolipin synthase
MSYLAFEDGKWAKEISEVLCSRVQAGIRVRLMVDEIGQVTDYPRGFFKNFDILHRLRSRGIQVDVFQPAAPLKINNRLHAKFAAIDDHMVFIGGSNIADYYTSWTDTNLRVEGELGNIFHKVYDHLLGFSKTRKPDLDAIDVKNLCVGNDHLWLTVPGHTYDIRKAIIDLILEAEKSVYIRAWYFLPDEEMLDVLCDQARRGVQINVLLSHQTRVRPVDFANYLHIHKLVCAGGHVYRYTGRYMHSKAAWNEKGNALIGSANLEPYSMRTYFESCLHTHDSKLTSDLYHSFYIDLAHSPKQTSESHLRRSLADKALTHTCNLAWLLL